MGLLDDMFGKSEQPDWQKQDYERCGKCGCSKMYHNTMCTKCGDCESFLLSGDIGMNP